MITTDALFNFFFTGLGVAVGQSVAELWIKPHLVRLKENGGKIKIRLGGL